MAKSNYGHDFYADRHQKTVYAAQTVLSIALEVLPEVQSAVDFGCGVGTWLSVLKERGVDEIQGLDGPWVEQGLLEIPSECFRQVNFEDTIHLERKYDLAISLEVAEHISEASSGRFVDSLTTAADFVLFSAAIPFQGGNDQVNEQWPVYWSEMFAKRGFAALDIVRERVWHDEQIPPWYRQNTLMFVKKEEVHRVKVGDADWCIDGIPMAVVHPDIFQLRVDQINQMSSVGGAWKLLRRAIRQWANGNVRPRAE